MIQQEPDYLDSMGCSGFPGTTLNKTPACCRCFPQSGLTEVEKCVRAALCSPSLAEQLDLCPPLWLGLVSVFDTAIWTHMMRTGIHMCVLPISDPPTHPLLAVYFCQEQD